MTGLKLSPWSCIIEFLQGFDKWFFKGVVIERNPRINDVKQNHHIAAVMNMI